MTSDLHRPGLQPLSHLKAGPTTSSSKSTARPASSAAQPSPQASSRPRISRNNLSREEQVDAASDKATTTLIRRVLCPQASSSSSLQELLPPLTSSNEVDRQLYALIAIIVKEFVYSWYSKITSDQIFVNELLQVIAHCTRALEQRLRQVDVAQLVLDEVPALVEAHITSYRLAKQQFSLSGLHTSTRTIYHALNPHPSLSPIPDPSHPETITQQRENELAYRQLLVHGTLAVLLPTEDLENTCLRTLVGDILADLILGSQVGGRVCEGRFLWEAITKLVDISQKSRDNERGTEDRLRKFGLIPSTEEEELQNSSWAYKSQQRVSAWIWGVLQYVYVTFIALRFVATGLFGVASGTPVTSSRETKGPPPTNATIAVNQRAVFDYRLFSMLSELLDVPRRMPWLGGLLALFQYLVLAGPGKLGDADSVLDRFLHETIQDYVLTPTLLPHLLLASRTALFPSNAPPPPPPPPAQGADSNRVAAQAQTQIPAPPTSPSAEEGAGSLTNANANASTPGKSGAPEMTALPTVSPDEETSSSAEIAVIKRQCAARLLALIPRSIARRFFGGGTSKNTTTNADTDGQGGITIPIEDNSNNNDPPYSDNGQSNNNDHDQMKNGHTSSPTSRITSTPTSSRDDDSQRQPQPHPHPKRHHQHAHQQAPLPTPPSDSSADQEKEEEEEEEAFLTTAIENEFLDLLADEYCNKHLVYSILETLLGKLLPELRERSVGGLLEDRGVSLSIPSITGDGGGGDATTVSSS